MGPKRVANEPGPRNWNKGRRAVEQRNRNEFILFFSTDSARTSKLLLLHIKKGMNY